LALRLAVPEEGVNLVRQDVTCATGLAKQSSGAVAATLNTLVGAEGTMPYILISTQIRMEVGPTMVGDEHSDPNLMNYLGAIKRNMLGNHFWEYYVNDAPRIVLDKLEKCGYRVISMTGVGQTLVWCLHKEMTGNYAFPPSQNIAVNHPA
ncbi:GTP cyclohydrolase 1 feedback regulatory protein, partial [Ophiophagus hannah]